jgi:hypothetical protein
MFVVLTHDPHTTAHFNAVASEMFRGSYVECEQYLNDHHGYIWRASFWDNRNA